MPHAQRDKECQSAHPAAKHLTQKLRRRQHKLRSGRACGVVPSAVGRYVGRGAERSAATARSAGTSAAAVVPSSCGTRWWQRASQPPPELCKRGTAKSGKVAFELGAAPIKRIRRVRPQRAAIREWRRGTHEHRLRPHDLLVQPEVQSSAAGWQGPVRCSDASTRRCRAGCCTCLSQRAGPRRATPAARSCFPARRVATSAQKHRRPATGVERVWRVGGRSFLCVWCDDVMTPLFRCALALSCKPLVCGVSVGRALGRALICMEELLYSTQRTSTKGYATCYTSEIFHVLTATANTRPLVATVLLLDILL